MNNGGPWWARFIIHYGLSTLLVLFLLGMIPGLRSPIDRITERIEAHDSNLQVSASQTAANLVRSNRELLRVIRTICRYQVPRDRQWECEPLEHRDGPR